MCRLHRHGPRANMCPTLAQNAACQWGTLPSNSGHKARWLPWPAGRGANRAPLRHAPPRTPAHLRSITHSAVASMATLPSVTHSSSRRRRPSIPASRSLGAPPPLAPLAAAARARAAASRRVGPRSAALKAKRDTTKKARILGGEREGAMQLRLRRLLPLVGKQSAAQHRPTTVCVTAVLQPHTVAGALHKVLYCWQRQRRCQYAHAQHPPCRGANLPGHVLAMAGLQRRILGPVEVPKQPGQYEQHHGPSPGKAAPGAVSRSWKGGSWRRAWWRRQGTEPAQRVRRRSLPRSEHQCAPLEAL